jgi:hypothetical protein
MPAGSLRVLPKARPDNSPAVPGPSIPRAPRPAVSKAQADPEAPAVVPASAPGPALALRDPVDSAARGQVDSVALPAQRHLPEKLRVHNEPAMREAVADASSIRKLKKAR